MPTYVAKSLGGPIRNAPLDPVWAWYDMPSTTFPADTGDVRDASGQRAAGSRASGCSWSTGPSGPCLSFDGSANAYVSLADIGFPSAKQPRTVGVRYRRASSNAGAEVLVGYGLANVTLWEWFGIYLEPTRKPAISDWGGSVVAPSSLSDAEWHVVIATYDGTTAILYVDGSAVASGTLTGASTTTTLSGCWIGQAGNGGGLYFTGDIDWCAVWSRVLSAEEVVLWSNDPTVSYLVPDDPILSLVFVDVVAAMVSGDATGSGIATIQLDVVATLLADSATTSGVVDVTEVVYVDVVASLQAGSATISGVIETTTYIVYGQFDGVTVEDADNVYGVDPRAAVGVN